MLIGGDSKTRYANIPPVLGAILVFLVAGVDRLDAEPKASRVKLLENSIFEYASATGTAISCEEDIDDHSLSLARAIVAWRYPDQPLESGTDAMRYFEQILSHAIIEKRLSASKPCNSLVGFSSMMAEAWEKVFWASIEAF